MKLRELAPEVYAKFVLPQTAELWANGRSLETYVVQSLEIAHSPFGRRSYRTFGLYDGELPLASFKRYERVIRQDNARLRAFGIGAVFTAPQARGKGYASAMLAMMLDDARRAGVDVAYLFSNIHPQFYKDIGFLELPSRSISIRSDALDGERIEVDVLGERDWTGVRKCFSELQARRPWAFERSPIVWDWVRMRMRHRSEYSGGQPVNLVVRRGRGVSAYVLGQREPAHDCYAVDEFGFVDDAARASVPRLLRSAAGDLRRITGWLPPRGARELLPRGSVRRRADAIWMAAPLSARGTAFVRQAQTSSSSDGVWCTDHV
ncbi:MAG: GNAT family N-acetyltransferase [Vulcanimicrobiaceae bacterium]